MSRTMSSHDEVNRRVVEARRLRAEGFSLAETAAKMGVPKSSVNYYWYKGKSPSMSSGYKRPGQAKIRRKLHGVVSVLGATTTNGTGKAGLKEWLEQYLASPNLQEIVRIIERGEI